MAAPAAPAAHGVLDLLLDLGLGDLVRRDRALLDDLLSRVEAQAGDDHGAGHAEEGQPEGDAQELGVVGDDVDHDRRDPGKRREQQERGRRQLGPVARAPLLGRWWRAHSPRSPIMRDTSSSARRPMKKATIPSGMGPMPPRSQPPALSGSLVFST